MHLLALVIANRKTYKCRAYLKRWEGVEEEAEDKSADHYGVQSNVYLVVYVVNRNLIVVLLLIYTRNTEHVSWKLRPVREWPTTTLTGIYPYIHISIYPYIHNLCSASPESAPQTTWAGGPGNESQHNHNGNKKNDYCDIGSEHSFPWFWCKD